MGISLQYAFEVRLSGFSVTVCGEDYGGVGKRQLVPCPEGELTGPDIHGTILPAGIDHQLIRADGICEINACYGFILDHGSALYIHAEGIRVPPQELREAVKRGEPVDPSSFYYVTSPRIEVYDPSLRWMMEKVFVCDAVRLPDAVKLTYYTVEQDHSG